MNSNKEELETPLDMVNGTRPMYPQIKGPAQNSLGVSKIDKHLMKAGEL